MAKPKIQAPVEVIELFAVYRADKYECTYPLSHHQTKAGAYREMRRQIVAYWIEQWEGYQADWRVMVAESGMQFPKRLSWRNPMEHVRFFVGPDNLTVYE